MQKIFLDTNVVIDFLGERNGYYEPMAWILTLADRNRLHLFTSALSIATSYYILAKYENAEGAINKIRKFKMLSKISMIDDQVIDKAIQSGFRDFEDTIQYYSALASACNIIVTRNEKDFKKASIPVMDPLRFLKEFHQSK